VLNLPLDVYVPSSAKQRMLNIIKSYKTTTLHVQGLTQKLPFLYSIHSNEGKNWDAANELAEKQASKDPQAFMVHPFNQKSTWQGHASMIDETFQQMMAMKEYAKPAAVVTCIGGGGLAIGESIFLRISCETRVAPGLLMGMERVGWEDVALVAIEAEGGDCFNKYCIEMAYHMCELYFL